MRRYRRNPGANSAQYYTTVLAHLLALKMLYWEAHWHSSGNNFYGQHLLFERLYDPEGEPNIDDQIDGLAERIMAYYPRQISMSELLHSAQHYLTQWTGLGSSSVDAALSGEISLQKAIGAAWQDNQKIDIALGLDAFLTGLASEREVVIYLLKQSRAPTAFSREVVRRRK